MWKECPSPWCSKLPMPWSYPLAHLILPSVSIRESIWGKRDALQLLQSSHRTLPPPPAKPMLFLHIFSKQRLLIRSDSRYHKGLIMYPHCCFFQTIAFLLSHKTLPSLRFVTTFPWWPISYTLPCIYQKCSVLTVSRQDPTLSWVMHPTLSSFYLTLNSSLVCQPSSTIPHPGPFSSFHNSNDPIRCLLKKHLLTIALVLDSMLASGTVSVKGQIEPLFSQAIV